MLLYILTTYFTMAFIVYGLVLAQEKYRENERTKFLGLSIESFRYKIYTKEPSYKINLLIGCIFGWLIYVLYLIISKQFKEEFHDLRGFSIW